MPGQNLKFVPNLTKALKIFLHDLDNLESSSKDYCLNICTFVSRSKKCGRPEHSEIIKKRNSSRITRLIKGGNYLL